MSVIRNIVEIRKGFQVPSLIVSSDPDVGDYTTLYDAVANLPNGKGFIYVKRADYFFDRTLELILPASGFGGVHILAEKGTKFLPTVNDLTMIKLSNSSNLWNPSSIGGIHFTENNKTGITFVLVEDAWQSMIYDSIFTGAKIGIHYKNVLHYCESIILRDVYMRYMSEAALKFEAPASATSFGQASLENVGICVDNENAKGIVSSQYADQYRNNWRNVTIWLSKDNTIGWEIGWRIWDSDIHINFEGKSSPSSVVGINIPNTADKLGAKVKYSFVGGFSTEINNPFNKNIYMWRNTKNIIQNLLVNKTVNSAQTTIPHGLDVIPNRIQILNLSDGRIWRSAASDATNIYLTADVDGRTCDIWVEKVG